MENPPPSTVSLAERALVPERIASGVWSLDEDRLVSVEGFAEGPATVLVRSEHVPVLPAMLPPLPNANRRRQALPFAITWDASWKPGEEAWAEVATTDGVATRTALQPGVISIPHLAKLAPDGELGEWPASALLPS